MKHLYWPSEKAWAAIEPHLPHGKPDKPYVDDLRVISGILKTGCRWRDCPAEHGPATTIYNRYNRWSSRCIWQRVFEKMAAIGPAPDELSLDSTHV